MDRSQPAAESSKMLETLEERLSSANLALEAARLELMERRLQMMEKKLLKKMKMTRFLQRSLISWTRGR